MASKTDQLLAKALIENGIISSESAKGLLAEAPKSGFSLFELVISRRIIQQDACLKILAEALDLEFADLKSTAIPKEVIERVPVKVASYYKFLPLRIHD